MNEISKPHGKAFQKALAVICTICLLLPFGAVTAGAKSAATITASSCTVERGTTASVTFNIGGNPGMFSLVLGVEYDSSVMTLKSVSNGSIFPAKEVVMGSISANPFKYTCYTSNDKNTNANGLVVTLNFTVNKNAAYGSYSVKVTQAKGYNDSYKKFDFSATNGSVAVVACAHTNKEWRTTTPAKCEADGKEALTCKKCGATFEIRTIKATGHKNTVVKNAVAATKTAEGYTGDTYCKDCGKLISKGKAIAKLKTNSSVASSVASKPSVSKPSVTSSSVASSSGTSSYILNSSSKESVTSTVSSDSRKPEIISDSNLSFIKNSNEPLVFVSDADFSEFIRAEIDGATMDEKDFTAESGSTIIKVNPDFLNELSEGEHTVSIVSTSGTASAQFTVQNEQDTSSAEEAVAEDNSSDNASSNALIKAEDKPSSAPIIIAIIIVVILAGGAAAYFVIRKRR